MNHDEYGEVINGEETYKQIADILKNQKRSILIGWTDGDVTHFDILFTYAPDKAGTNLQGGIKHTDLFVSVMRKGAFAFEAKETETHPSYFEEKLGFMGIPTKDVFAELINGVRKHL